MPKKDLSKDRDVDIASTRLGALLSLEKDVKTLSGAGGSRAQALSKLGIRTIKDLLFNPPKRYIDFTNISRIADVAIGQNATVIGVVDRVVSRNLRPRLNLISADVVDSSGVINAIWFNQPWIATSLHEGDKILLQGPIDHRNGYKQIKPQRLIILEEQGKKTQTQLPKIWPIYKQTKGITSAWIKRLVNQAFEISNWACDIIPVNLRIQNNLMSRYCALRNLHLPNDMRDVELARRRLAYEELLLLQIYWLRQRFVLDKKTPSFSHTIDGKTFQAFMANLPFELTDEQYQALNDILADMASSKKMSRMVLGDVGTGKTIVAAGALSVVGDNDSQGVLMAPTEVLARQYGVKIGPILDTIGIRWATLTSSTSAKDRKDILAGIKSGTIQVLFATHAAIEDSVVFSNLTLAIVDEQHRFGVVQREKLQAKGEACDYLCMTATPIPRSLAMTVYGNLDCSYIKKRPGQAQNIETKVIDKRNRFIAFDEIRKCVAQGSQAYIVCPLIDSTSSSDTDEQVHDTVIQDSEGEQNSIFDDDKNYEAPLDEDELEKAGSNIAAAKAEAKYLAEEVFPEMNIGLLCGSMSSQEKNATMDSFRRGEIDVLVSTTVVEVGVDVANATLMVVEDAQRFGLAQLHQLRGRVGRGKKPGKMILLARLTTEEAKTRMKAMEEISDGFELAALDLKMRREGDVIGSRQHGLPALKFANVISDEDLVRQAREDAKRLLEEDPELLNPDNALLAREVRLKYSYVAQ